MVVTDRDGAVLATATGEGLPAACLQSHCNDRSPTKYFIRSRARARRGVGRYGLGVTFNGTLHTPPIPLAQVLRGPYETLDDEEIQTLFTNPDGGYYNDDLGADDTPALAGALPPLPGFPDNSRYSITASLASVTDADFYAVRAPQSNDGTVVLTAVARAIGPNGTTPRIQVFRVLDDNDDT